MGAEFAFGLVEEGGEAVLLHRKDSDVQRAQQRLVVFRFVDLAVEVLEDERIVQFEGGNFHAAVLLVEGNDFGGLFGLSGHFSHPLNIVEEALWPVI